MEEGPFEVTVRRQMSAGQEESSPWKPNHARTLIWDFTASNCVKINVLLKLPSLPYSVMASQARTLNKAQGYHYFLELPLYEETCKGVKK